MKTKITASLFLLGLGLWTMNVVSSIHRIFGLQWLAPKILDTMPTMVRVDISTVTTLVVAMTLFYVARGSWRIDRRIRQGKEPDKLWHEHFPFERGFGTLLVQLGLLGTIFAFIIAFNDLSEATVGGRESYDPTILITPLGTALWSTFSGIFCAFIVVPALVRLFRGWVGAAVVENQEVDEGIGVVGRAFDKLEQRVDGAKDGFDRLQKKLEGLVVKLQALDHHSLFHLIEKGLELGRQTESTLVSLQATSQQLDLTLKGMSRQFGKAPRALAKATDALDSLRGELRQQQASSKALSGSLDGAGKALAGNTAGAYRLSADLQASRQVTSELRKNLGGLGEKLGDLASILETSEPERGQLKAIREQLRGLEKLLGRAARRGIVARLWQRTRWGAGGSPVS